VQILHYLYKFNKCDVTVATKIF